MVKLKTDRTRYFRDTRSATPDRLLHRSRRLVLVEREKDHAFLATKVGQLAVQLNKSDTSAAPHCRLKLRPMRILAR